MRHIPRRPRTGSQLPDENSRWQQRRNLKSWPSSRNFSPVVAQNLSVYNTKSLRGNLDEIRASRTHPYIARGSKSINIEPRTDIAGNRASDCVMERTPGALVCDSLWSRSKYSNREHIGRMLMENDA